MNHFLRLLALTITISLVSGCINDNLENPPSAEMYYVDLLYALHHFDQSGAEEAAQKITKIIGKLPFNNYPMRSDNEKDVLRLNMSKAQTSYLQVCASIEKNELEQAMIQLNRATNELEAARIPGYQDFYIARIHEFFSSWLEVSRTSRQEDLSSREWRAINRRIKTAYMHWRECQWVQPSPSVYYFSMEDTAEFTRAHGEVDRLIELLKASLSEDDEVLTKSYVDATDSAIWAFVRLFGSPQEGKMEILHPEKLEPTR